MKKLVLKNDTIELTIVDIGASIYDFKYLDKSLVKKADSYLDNPEFLGASVAPLAGRYNIDGEIILHSGDKTIHNKSFSFDRISDTELELTYDYLHVKYILLENGFRVEYSVKSVVKLPLNVTNHSYFCLDEKQDINTHFAIIQSDYMALKDSNNLAIGFAKNSIEEIDFEKNKVDDYYYFKNKNAFSIVSKVSNIRVDISTSYPGVVLYTYNNPVREKNIHSAVAIECQYPPNDLVLRKEYKEFIEYRVRGYHGYY